ncbi:putative Fe-S protein YdhL (DUF1289 family) [Robbsia andropogonis]|nr:DUF1289 domain-containing protein [Robbsia andropogonis]MCP1119604.1 DUF1289 domain-containing protein [Robbsia andropogonis]MCP1129587.1 DUF1289 domain-containing protein [Robbsia andropogonis]
MTLENTSDLCSENHPYLLKKIQMALSTTPAGSPCINICKLDEVTRTYCTGCRRSRAEIKAWKTLDDSEKYQILRRIAREMPI